MADNRKSRSEATKAALMRAAERLIAEHGIENISIRQIVAHAGQKNESALQYHFKSLTGLINAIHASRDAEIRERRRQLLVTYTEQGQPDDLRAVCELMVLPAFQLACERADFRRYVRAFGHEMAMTTRSALDMANRKGGETSLEVGVLLRQALPHLDGHNYEHRMEYAVRFCAVSMAHHARQKAAFRGASAQLFCNELLDALAGLLSAPVSDATRLCMATDQST